MKNKERRNREKNIFHIGSKPNQKEYKIKQKFLAKGKQNENLIDKLNKLAHTGMTFSKFTPIFPP